MFRSVLDGLEGQPVDVLVTIGSGRDPATIGPVPGNAHVEQYVPQSPLMPECALVICHGGAGTTLGALAHGVPLLLLPQGADQYIISERVAASGAGLRLVPSVPTPFANVRSSFCIIRSTARRPCAFNQKSRRCLHLTRWCL